MLQPTIFILLATVRDDIDKTYLVIQIIFAILLVVGTFFLLRFIFRHGLMCHLCGDTDLKVWDRLTDEQQQDILDYFDNYENRRPDTSGILVCEKCKTVFDDFSEEKGSGDIRRVSSGPKDSRKTVVTCRTYCKICNVIIASCDPEKENIFCRRCGTQYHWKVHERSGYRFLMPPKDADVQKKCTGFLG